MRNLLNDEISTVSGANSDITIAMPLCKKIEEMWPTVGGISLDLSLCTESIQEGLAMLGISNKAYNRFEQHVISGLPLLKSDREL